MGRQWLLGAEFQFCKMGRSLGVDGRDGCTTTSMSLVPPNCTLKNGKMSFTRKDNMIQISFKFNSNYNV